MFLLWGTSYYRGFWIPLTRTSRWVKIWRHVLPSENLLILQLALDALPGMMLNNAALGVERLQKWRRFQQRGSCPSRPGHQFTYGVPSNPWQKIRPVAVPVTTGCPLWHWRLSLPSKASCLQQPNFKYSLPSKVEDFLGQVIRTLRWAIRFLITSRVRWSFGSF